MKRRYPRGFEKRGNSGDGRKGLRSELKGMKSYPEISLRIFSVLAAVNKRDDQKIPRRF